MDFPVRKMAYQMILSSALPYANNDSRKPAYLGGDIFRLPNKFDALSLWYDDKMVAHAITAAQKSWGEVRSADEITQSLTEIVRDSIVNAINNDQEAAEAFGALIVENARNNVPLEDWF